jgi:hypothetical protein
VIYQSGVGSKYSILRDFHVIQNIYIYIYIDIYRYIYTHLDPYRYSFFIKNCLWSILNSQFQPTISNPIGSYPVSSLCIGVGTRKKRSIFPKMNKI